MKGYKLTSTKSPQDNDVLSGRGNYVNAHPGNRRFRGYVNTQRELYLAAPKSKKPFFARMIVNAIKSLVPPGRFLKKDPHTDVWSDIGEREAWNKTRQSLRDIPLNSRDSSHRPVFGLLLPNLMANGMPSSLSCTTNPASFPPPFVFNTTETMLNAAQIHMRAISGGTLQRVAAYQNADNMQHHTTSQQYTLPTVGSTVGNNQYISHNSAHTLVSHGSLTATNDTTLSLDDASRLSEIDVSDWDYEA